MMSKLKKGDWIRAVAPACDAFTQQCEYHVEKVTSGVPFVYSDEGDLTRVDFPHDGNYGKFEKVD